MTGHFVTACGCEKYQTIECPAPVEVRLPLKEVTKPMSSWAGGWVTLFGTRTFRLASVDMKHALAHYEEVQ